jgi:type IV secretory pathway VirB3-like protein
MTSNKPIILIIIIIIVAVAKHLLGYSSEEVILRIIICANALVSNLGSSKMTLFWGVMPYSVVALSCRSYRCENLKSGSFYYTVKRSMAIH